MIWHRNRLTTPDALAQQPEMGPDHAWRTLDLVKSWVIHAESKAAAAITAAGIIGGILYNFVRSQHHPGIAFDVGIISCAALVALTATCAGIAVAPRLQSKWEPTSLIYFDHIARRHEKSSGSGAYTTSLRNLLSNEEDLIDELGYEVWANAHVARDKYRWVNRAIVSLLLSIIPLVTVALILALPSFR